MQHPGIIPGVHALVFNFLDGWSCTGGGERGQFKSLIAPVWCIALEKVNAYLVSAGMIIVKKAQWNLKKNHLTEVKIWIVELKTPGF